MPRLVIGLTPSTDKEAVRRALRGLGVQADPSPHPVELPDILVAEVEDGDALDRLLGSVRAVDGVAYAHRESIAQGFGDVVGT